MPKFQENFTAHLNQLRGPAVVRGPLVEKHWPKPFDNNLESSSQMQDNNYTASATENCLFYSNKLHPRRVCPARNVICYNCLEKGHFAKVCRSRKASTTSYVVWVLLPIVFRTLTPK